MSKIKLFIDNFLIYGLGGIISKIIPLIMVPIITRIMPTTEFFGLSDLSNTVVQFGSALAVMGMYDAMYRLFFDKSEELYRRTLCSTTLTFSLFTSAVVFFVMIALREPIAQGFFGNKQYSYVVFLSAMATLVGATNSIISAPTRMQNKRCLYLIMNSVSPLLAYSVSIPLLLAGYYTIALPLANVISSVTMEITFGVINRKWFRIGKIDKAILKQLLLIAIPLLPNFLIYWIFNSADKVMITNLIGVSHVGVYSVGSKLGHASHLIYTAFAGGWQYFAFSTMREKNQVESNSRVFEYLGAISFVATAFTCSVSYYAYDLLFEGEYVEGFIIAPYLFLAPLLQMLFQVAGNQFLVIKKTWPNLLILSGGAGVNLILNYVLIPIIGIEGAAIATLVGYIISDIVAVIVLINMKLMKIRIRFLFLAMAMILFFVVWRLFASDNIMFGGSLAIGFVGVVVGLYKTDLEQLTQLVRTKMIR